MKYSNTTIRELNARYRSVLKKCFMLNAMVLMGLASNTAFAGDYDNLHTLTPETANMGTVTIENEHVTSEYGSVYIVPNGVTGVIGENSVIRNNTAGIGTIGVSKKEGVLQVGSGTVFENNTAKYDGGAIGNYGGAIIADNVTFTGNKAQTGSSDSQAIGGGAISLGIDAHTTITGSTFTNNTSGYSGGAIGTRKTLQDSEVADAETRNSLTIENSVFKGNEALGTLTDTSDKNLLSSGNGGAIANTFATTRISGTTFDGNKALNSGGAIFNMPFENAKSTAFYDVGGAMTLSDSTFSNNSAGKNGGAIFNGGDMTIDGGSFSNNTATSYFSGGGAIFNQGSLTISNGTVFENNSAYVGGAISDVYDVAAQTTISGAQFNNNHSIWDGGALTAYAKVDVSDTVFSGNTAAVTVDGVTGDPSYSDGGGAIMVGGTSDVSLTNVQFIGNESGVRGGAISARHGKDRTLTMDTVEFTNNKAGNFGGAIASIYQGAVDVKNGQFTGNEAAKAGGAIYIGVDTNYGAVGGVTSTNHGTLNLSGENVFTGNTAGEKGGAIYADEGATSNLLGVNTFENNQAEDGGAVFNMGTMTIGDGVRFAGNASTNNGGAIYNDKNASLTIGNNATFHDNMLIDNGANHGTDIYNNGGTVIMGDNLTVSRSEGYTSEHDCAFMNKAGSTMTIGQNALFKNVSEVLITESGTYSIGNNARFEGVGNGFSNWGGQITLGDNATFLNGTARALQNANNTTGSITVGANAVFDGNTDVNEVNGGGTVIFNGDKASMTFGDGFIARNNRAEKGNSVIYNGTNSTLVFNGASTFENNGTANKSGVIRNWGTLTFDGAATFTGNSAASDGGALFNGEDATVTFNSDATFTGNSAGNVPNDIQNNGTLTFASGTATIGSGVAGTGALNIGSGATLDIGTAKVVQDSITFDAGSTLKANLLNTSSYGSLEANTIAGNGAKLNLTVGAAGEYQIAVGEGADSFAEAEVDSSSLYDIVKTSEDSNTLTYTASVKAAEDIASDAGVSTQTASVLSTLANASNDTASQIALNMQNELAAGNNDTVESAAKDLAPTDTATVHSVATSVHSQILSAVNNRLATPVMGRSGGDLNAKFGPWVQGLYNKSKQDSSSSTTGFRGYTQGVAFGLDTLINDVYTVGVGYAYNATDVKSGGRKTDIYGHNFFVYGEYQPNAWFVNGTVNYSTSDYKEHRNVVGVGVTGKYDVDTWGGQVMTGYDMASGFTPKAGLRYLHIKQDSYTDTAGQQVKTDNTDLLTAVAGVNYAYDFVEKDYTLTPEVRLAATYDIVSDNTDATVFMGTGSYTTSGKRLPRFGVEAGVGVTMNMFDALDVSLNYDAGIRRDYTSHTGTVKFKYNF